ncbi:MAG: hypothetical protein M3478_15705, partial [Planctomycetota bacterium]|nr:hypothetical protein [Planctomycetota bacterium]
WEAREARHERPPEELADALDVAQALADPAGAVERFSRIAQRLEQSVSRALRELRQLRTDRREAEEYAPCPYLEGLDEDDEEEEDMHAEACTSSGVRTSVRMSPEGATVVADDPVQNEPNSAEPVAGDDGPKGYDGAGRNINLAELMKLAARDAALRTGNRGRDLKLA